MMLKEMNCVIYLNFQFGIEDTYLPPEILYLFFWIKAFMFFDLYRAGD